MSFLGDFVDSVAHLPSNLRRNAAALRALDERADDLAKALRAAEESAASRPAESAQFKRDVRRVKEIEKAIMSIADTKVEVATVTYDMLDAHVRRLDDDLNRFEDELVLANVADRDALATMSAAAALDADATRAEGRADEPQEPVYCVCRQVAFGEMIACDNPECKYEWFHFRCVGITPSNKPKTRWFCPDCTRLRRKGLLAL